MTQQDTKNTDLFLTLGLAAASVILAIGPLDWLWQSWRDPAYQSDGAWYLAGLLALCLRSLVSGPPRGAARPEPLLALFALAAVLRLAGQVMAVNILAALALSVDVLALALWLRLDHRPRPLAPLWLAAVFLFALPLGPLLERVLGFPLQMVSARIACQMLGPLHDTLICDGVRLGVDGVDVLVDLPCSGASGLLLMLCLWCVLNAVYRPGLAVALRGGLGVLVAAIMGNALRISLLATGLARGVDVMQPALHSASGLVTLALSTLAVLALYQPKAAPRRALPLPRLPRSAQAPLVGLALILSLAIVQAPKKPFDRSAPLPPVALPAQLAGHRAQPAPLSATETRYFTQFGGQAAKAHYGPLGLNVVETSSPLRHLHSPATCLLGLGYAVRFLGTRHDPVPTAIYEATAPDGRVWHVAVSFVSDRGQITPSVGAAVWLWLSGEARRWRSVQRITPADLTLSDRAGLDAAALAALDI